MAHQGTTQGLLQQAGLPSRALHHHCLASSRQHKQETTQVPPSLSKCEPKKTKRPMDRAKSLHHASTAQHSAAQGSTTAAGTQEPGKPARGQPPRGIHFVKGMASISKTQSGCAAHPSQGRGQAGSIREGFADTQTSMLPGKTRERNVRSKF